jgi:hypothetical protein
MQILSGLFRKNKKETENGIQLYCQNPQCNRPLIPNGEEVADVNGNLVHVNKDCIIVYMGHEAIRTRNVVFCSEVKYLLYGQAEELAKEGKLKVGKLERGIRK